MRKTNPAFVYAPAASAADMRGIDECLRREDLYRCDDAVEAGPDLLGPVACRPVLRRALFLAEQWGVRAVVTDGVASLGADAVERTATVAAVNDLGLELLVGGKPLPASWYTQRVRELGFQRVRPVTDSLLERPTLDLLERWDDIFGGLSWVQPSSDRSAPLAALRVKELREVEGLGYTQIADRLRLEGYLNRNNHRAWYTGLARQAYEAGL